MKVPIDTVNIWYSPHLKKWTVCALVVTGIKCNTAKNGWATPSQRRKREPEGLKREKSTHETLGKALQHVSESYQDWRNTPLEV